MSKEKEEDKSQAARTGLAFLTDVAMHVTVEFARSKLTVKKTLSLSKGSIVELDKMAGEPLDIRVNGKLVARGEAVIVNDRFGIRVTEIISSADFEEGAGNAT